MATAKRKKSNPQSSFSAIISPNLDQADSSQFLAVTAVSLDDEPKVSFTLEFYPVDEKVSSFIGRLKKIGSEEQVTLIDDLDSEVLLDFIRRNLPKNWRKQDFNKATTNAKAEADPTPTSTLSPQALIGAPALVAKTEPYTKELPTGKLEIWQNGRRKNVLESFQAISLRFGADTVSQWTEYNVHFKSLETNVPSHNIKRKQIVNGQLEVALPEAQLKPGMYDLKFSAVTTGDKIVKESATFTANQLIQVI